jgi:hypothetical protein
LRLDVAQTSGKESTDRI